MASWQPGVNYTTGQYVEPPSVLDFGYEATTPGTSGLTEPAWPLVNGATIADGTMVWTARAATTVTWTAVALYRSGVTEPVWPTVVGATVADGDIAWTTRTAAITDPKCPQSRIAMKLESKVYSPYRDVVRYCATNYPRDWSTQDDAGFINVGLNAQTSPEPTSLGEYRGRLAVQTASDMLVYTVDPDPAENSLYDIIPGLGTNYADASTSVSGDMFFLTPQGVRSMSIAAGSVNIQAGDIGTPIDPLIQAKLAGPVTPRGMYYPGAGQFWLAFDNEVFVYSQSRLGKVGAWSRYVFPYNIEAWTQLNGNLYLRSGDKLYRLDEAAISDDGVEFEGVVWWPYLDLGNPGTTKNLDSLDVVGYGSPHVSIGYDQVNTSAYTTPYLIAADTVPGGRIPMSVAAPTMAVKLVYAPGQSWELLAAALYVQDQAMGR